MSRRRQSPLLPIMFIGIAIVCLLVLGALEYQKGFLTRGIPPDLPGPMIGSGPEIGLNLYLDSEEESAIYQSLSEVAAAGFQNIKLSFYYDEAYDWQASDRLVAAINEHNLTLVPLLDGNPADNFAPLEPNEFAQWAGEFARRYGDWISAYMIWDEPNIGQHWGFLPVNPAEYAAILSEASTAIKNVDPDALIVAAPLAPNVESGPDNLADDRYLQAFYDTGIGSAFDIAASKPYGFNLPPDDRTVDRNIFNFSRAILLREVMDRNGDQMKALWAANWGWNSLPPNWQGDPSIWGQVDRDKQEQWTLAAFERARLEWPWMGLMFLENWDPGSEVRDPRWGFSIRELPLVQALSQIESNGEFAWPGYYPANKEQPAQAYDGAWRFSSKFGADAGQSGDAVDFRFKGTDVGLRIRRADVRGRFFVDVDDEPANQLPIDNDEASLLLTSADPNSSSISTEAVAEDLSLSEHVLRIISPQATDQWSLSGFSVGYKPPLDNIRGIEISLFVIAIAMFALAVHTGRVANWGKLGTWLRSQNNRLSQRGQLALTALSAILVAASGWLTWGDQAAGIYRRLGDSGQLALTAAAASIFYVSPSFLLYLTALLILFVLVYFRPAWGLAVVAFSIPFYVKPKELLGYRFSPVEVFLLVTFTTFTLHIIISNLRRWEAGKPKREWHIKLVTADWAALTLTVIATLSLFFTERLSVATNEWRVVILEPAIFYLLLRTMRLKDREMWVIFDAFVAAGFLVALIGLGQYLTGQNLITSEGGLMRLRSIFGSPNNVALYLGRITPILLAMTLMGHGKRRTIYFLLLIPITIATILTFSKGALFLGLPLSLLVVILIWRRSIHGRIWPWLTGVIVLGLVLFILISQVPQLSARLDITGETGVFRLNLWRSSLNMFLDHPIIGVGLDNFLYEYRGRYIADASWKEPNLNHPHNIVLDFATRLGILGLIAGGWLFWSYLALVRKLPARVQSAWRPVAVGLLGSFIYVIAHGLVDHSFFLTDLAYSFYLLLGLAVWLDKNAI